MIVLHKLIFLLSSVVVVTIYHTGIRQKSEVPSDSKENVVVKVICPANEDTVYYEHETDKSLFYKCVDGRGIVMSCPERDFFDPKLQRCTDGKSVDSIVEMEVDQFENFVPLETKSTVIPTTSTRGYSYCTTLLRGSTNIVTSSYPCATIGSSSTSSRYDPYCTTVIPGSTNTITSTWLCTTTRSSNTYVPTSTIIPTSSVPTSSSDDPYCTTVIPGSTNTITSTWFCTTTGSSGTYVPTSTPYPYCTTVIPGSTNTYTSTWICTTSTASRTTRVRTNTIIPTSSVPTSGTTSSTGTTSTLYPSSTVESSSSTDSASSSLILPTSTSAYIIPTDDVSPTVTPVLPNNLPRLVVI